MIQRDFIMRMIQLLGVFFRRASLLIEKGDLEQVDEEANAIAKKMLGLPMAVLEGTSVDSLIELFTTPLGTDYGKVFGAAALVEVSGDVVFANGDEILAGLRWADSTRLYLKASESMDDEIGRKCLARINDLAKRLVKEYQMDPAIHLALSQYYRDQGRYELAENHLFEGVENDPNRVGIILRFCEDLLKLEDSELERGGLPRQEIEEVLSQF